MRRRAIVNSEAWSSFASIFTKELIHVRRDRTTMAAALVLPLFQLGMFGFIDLTVTNVPTVVVDQDHSGSARRFVERLRATRVFDVIGFSDDPRTARDAIVSGRARVAVILPPEFHDAQTAGRESPVRVVIDGSDSNVSSQALAAVTGVAADSNARAVDERLPAGTRAPAATVAVRPTILFNPAGRTANFILPGLIAIILQILAIVLAAVSLARERERGTLDQLLVTPIHPLGLILGKLAPYLIIGIAEVAGILAVMRFAFGVQIHGSIAFLFAMTLIYLASLLSIGLAVGARAETQAQATQIAQVLLLPSIFLSGYIFPQPGLPVALRWVGQLLPATHMIEILRGAILRGAGPLDLAPEVAALALTSAVMIWIAARRFGAMNGT
jgi:ABC-2 type transport system permease protein